MNWLTLIGGFADRQTLHLRRAPKLLRVVVNDVGNWDALDQFDDTPAADETIFVYVRDAKPESRGMVDYCGKNGRRQGGMFVAWDYRALNEPPPDESVLRDTVKWREWCRANGPRLCPREPVPAGGAA